MAADGFRPDLRARSAWSSLNEVDSVEVVPVTSPVTGQVVIPGSKSFTNRALVMAGAAHGISEISGILRSDDSFWLLDSLKALGVDVEVQQDVVRVHGCGGQWPVKEADLYIGAAGTTARFLPGLLAASSGGRWTVTGSDRLNERPMKDLIDALQSVGGDIRYRGEQGHLPLEIHGQGIRGGQLDISGSTSSQFVSGVLIAAPYAPAPLDVHIVDHVVQHAYVHITLDLMRQFGAVVDADDRLETVRIQPDHYQARTVELEADASTACYFLALAAITQGDIHIRNLSQHTIQPDVGMANLLETMGCEVTWTNPGVRLRGTHQLKGGFTVSMKEMSDQALTLAAIAPFADGPITITDVAHIRGHESDRIRVMCESLTRLGIRAEEHADGLTVYPGEPRGARVESFDDHRVAMSLSLIGTRVPGIIISDPGCVSKTCPTYFELLTRMGVQVVMTDRV